MPYDLSDATQALQNPKSVAREINRLGHTRGRRYSYNPKGSSIFDADWDNLVILDACRYDAFVEQASIPGRTESRISRGGATFEWVRANFLDQVRHETVYVTANSWYQRLRDELGAEVFKLVDLHMGDADGSYHSDEYKVVLPDTMTDHAIEVAEQHPNKALIVHYLQPHHPFVGEYASEFSFQTSSSLNEVIERNGASAELVREAYRENLDIVLSEVDRLLPHLPGKTVVTADHGEMLGDRHRYLPVRDYGHHEGIYNEALTKVPWHVHQNGSRKRIVAEQPADEKSSADLEKLEERLERLGYKM